jgi:GntR family L-lactate dehydrogenase operon transcriptional regulator
MDDSLSMVADMLTVMTADSADNMAMDRPRLSDRIAVQLALQLGVSRTVLREAIARLSSQGLLRARVGGGTYVQAAATPVQRLVEPLEAYLPLFRNDPEYRFDVLEARHALEGAIAWHAALRATDEDREHITAAYQAMLDTHQRNDPAGEAQADAAFHLAIAEASHNLVLRQVMRGLFDLLQINISQSREKLYLSPRTFEPLTTQHRELMEAILAGDPERARAAALCHLEFVHSALRTLDDNEARRARASRLPSTADSSQ